MIRRIVIMIMDSVGIGEQADAAEYNSIGANTFHHVAQSQKNFKLPNLQKLGLGNIDGVIDIPMVNNPLASHGKMRETTCSIETFGGVWEMAGVIFPERFESFNPRIPAKLVIDMQEYIGINTLCNAYISGFMVLDKFADEHFSTGYPIVYTCDDGTILVAAHESVINPEKLRNIAGNVSRFFIGKQVSRIIARPFIGTKGKFQRTANRKDFIVASIQQSDHLFSRLRDADITFTTTEHLTSLIGEEFVRIVIPGIKDTAKIMDDICNYFSMDTRRLAMFVLPDFDMSGHRQEPETYAQDLIYFDSRLDKILQLIRKDDILIITADHGCDPISGNRGHTREYVPLLVKSGNRALGCHLGTRNTFADLGQTICDLFQIKLLLIGRSFARLVN